MSSVVISGDTSGAITLQAPAVSGNTTLNLPASSGTVLTQNSSAPANSLVVDASGNVGIGTSSPNSKLGINGDSNTNTSIRLQNQGTSIGFISNYASWIGSGSDNSFTLAAVGALPMVLATNGVERMRIDSSGNLLVGTTSLPSNGGKFTFAGGDLAVDGGYKTKAGNTTAFGGNRFNINWTGSAQLWIDVTNVGTIAFTSDYRIKKNINTSITPALERIEQLRPVTYEYADYKELFKEDGVQREGFIAHELAKVIPSAVEGEKDAENQIQSLKLDALCSVMVKAIQELKAIVDEQAEKIKALEAK